MNALVSIIIPVYNGENCIEKCIDSLQRQTYDRIEIIVVDDGSHDNTAIICNKYARDGIIHFFRQQNCGPAQARNLGISKAKGSYIAFIDADDYVDTEYISYLVYNLEFYRADISSCGWKNVDENGNTVSTCEQYKLVCYNLENMEIPEEKIPFTVWHMLYRKELIDRGKVLFDPDIFYQEDLLFNYRILLNSKKMVDSSIPLYTRVVNHNSLTNQKWSLEWYERWYTIVLAQERIVKMMEKYPQLYANALYNQSLETAKIYSLSKKHKIHDKDKIKKLKELLKLNKKKLQFIGKISIKKMLLTAACCFMPTIYCKLRKYNLR